MSQTRQHSSIGEVLKTLREEFSDVTISKIRFLETEGLIEPERTASGYRKFYPQDLARLRYILRLQRDHFMPLKVIRTKLENFDPSAEQEVAAADGSNNAEGGTSPSASPQDDIALVEGGLNLNFEDFLTATGLSYDGVRELEEYGLIESHTLDTGELYYDEDDLQIAKMAKEFAKFGIQPRHLKMYKNFAEKEVGLFEQVVVPISRTSGSEGRRNAAQSLAELAKLSRRLNQVLLRSNLRELLDT